MGNTMRVCIHRDTKEIGGTCVEIEPQGKRLVLDAGLPLDVADPNDFPCILTDGRIRATGQRLRFESCRVRFAQRRPTVAGALLGSLIGRWEYEERHECAEHPPPCAGTFRR